MTRPSCIHSKLNFKILYVITKVLSSHVLRDSPSDSTSYRSVYIFVQFTCVTSGMRPLLVEGWTVKWLPGQHRQLTDVSRCSQRPFVARIDLSWHNIEINRSARLSQGPVTPRPHRQLFQQLITCTYVRSFFTRKGFVH